MELTLIIGSLALLTIVIGVVIAVSVYRADSGGRYICECCVSRCDAEGKTSEEVRLKGKGKCVKLSKFRLGKTELDECNCRFMATDGDFAWFVSDKKVFVNGTYVNKIKLSCDGYPVEVKKEPSSKECICVRYIRNSGWTQNFNL